MTILLVTMAEFPGDPLHLDHDDTAESPAPKIVQRDLLELVGPGINALASTDLKPALMSLESPAPDQSPFHTAPDQPLARRGSTPSMDGSTEESVLKKQYDKKLRDVMEKAREHAKKIAGERDEFRRQLTERESEILKLKKNMQLSDVPPVDVDKLHSRIRELEQIPTDVQPNPVCVVDNQGTKWALLEESHSGRKSWWRWDLLDPSPDTNCAIISMEVFHRTKLEVDKLRKELQLRSVEFSQYKQKANSLLSERSVGSSSAPATDLLHVKKIMELEAQVEKLLGRISALEKRNADLEESEAETKSRLSKCVLECSELNEQSKKMVSENDNLSELLHRVQMELESERKKILKKSASFAASTTLSSPAQTEVTPLVSFVSSSTQTEASLPALPVLPTSPQKPSPSLLASSFDSVAIPLRQQIRSLMEEIDSEKRQHGLTQNQLQMVKEEFRKLTGECQHSSDLADPVKVEYMRNVGRKFFALAPMGVSEEFESLLPAILPLFQLPAEEIAVMLDTRRKKLAASRSRLW